MIRLAHGEQQMGIHDHLGSGDHNVIGAAAGADGRVAFIPKVNDIGVAEQAVAVGASAGSIGRFGLAVEIAGHGIEDNTEEAKSGGQDGPYRRAQGIPQGNFRNLKQRMGTR
jgi:hypothetical protein